MEGKRIWSRAMRISEPSEFIFVLKVNLFWSSLRCDSTPSPSSAERIKIKILKKGFFPWIESAKKKSPGFFPVNLTECLLSCSLLCWERRLKCLLLWDVVWSVTPSLCGLVWPARASATEAGVCWRPVEDGSVYLACPDVHRGLDPASRTCSLVSTCHSIFTGAGSGRNQHSSLSCPFLKISF